MWWRGSVVVYCLDVRWVVGGVVGGTSALCVVGWCGGAVVWSCDFVGSRGDGDMVA